MTEIKDNKIAEYTINPDDYHLKGKELKNIITDSHKSSLDMTLAVFNNEDSDALKIAVLNASLLVMLYKGDIKRCYNGEAMEVFTVIQSEINSINT